MRALMFDHELAKPSPNEFFTIGKWDGALNTLLSLFITSTGDNCPDVQTPFLGSNFLLYMIVVFYCIFSQIVIVSVMTGSYSNIFQEFYTNRIKILLGKDPNYKKLILKAVGN
jgi:hypothetical protein